MSAVLADIRQDYVTGTTSWSATFYRAAFGEEALATKVDSNFDQQVLEGLDPELQGRSYTDAIVQAVSNHLQSDTVLNDANYTQEMLDADLTRIGQEAIIEHVLALPAAEQVSALRELDTHSGSGANAAIFNQLEANPELLNAFTSALGQDESFRAGFVESLSAEGGSAIDPAALETALANPALSGALTTALTNIATNPEIGHEQFVALTTAVSAMGDSPSAEGFAAVETALTGLGLPAEQIATIRTAAVDAEIERVVDLPPEQQIDALRALDTEGAHTALIDVLASDEVLLESFTNAMQQDPSFREGITAMMTSEGEGGISSEQLAAQLENPEMRAQLTGILNNIADSDQINYGQFESLFTAVTELNSAEGMEMLAATNNLRAALTDLGLDNREVMAVMAIGAEQAMASQVGGLAEMFEGFVEFIKDIPGMEQIGGFLSDMWETIKEFVGGFLPEGGLAGMLGLSEPAGAQVETAAVDAVDVHMERNGYGALVI